jgi:hypothetical protein
MVTMTDRSLTRLAWSLCALTLLVLAASLVLILLGSQAPLPSGATPWRDRAVSLVGIIGAPILGGLIASRRPRNPYGWVWLGFGLGLALQQLGYSYATYARVVEPGPLLASLSISQVVQGGPVALGFAPFLLLLFPTGRLPSRRWRPLVGLAIFSGTVTWVLNYLYGRPDQVGGIVTIMVSVTVFVTFSVFVLAAFSLVARYRRASGIERQQLKWFALAAVVAVVFLIGEQLGLSRFLGGMLWNLLNVITNAALYAAVGIAIFRYRLYDIDIIINRTLVYGSLTLILALVVLRWRGDGPGPLPDADRATEAAAVRRRGLNAGYGRAVYTLETPYPVVYRQVLLPAQIRRCEDARRFLGEAA